MPSEVHVRNTGETVYDREATMNRSMFNIVRVLFARGQNNFLEAKKCGNISHVLLYKI